MTHSEDSKAARPFAPRNGRAAYVAGTFDTKARELLFLRDSIAEAGLNVVTVDLSTSQAPQSPADIPPAEVAGHHHDGASAVFTGDRGSAVTAMAEAFAAFVATRDDLAGLISAGGSGGDRAGDSGDARPARRRAQSDGVDRRLGRRARLCRPGRHLHDLFRHRRIRPQPHFAHRARQCRACFGRHDRAANARKKRSCGPPSASPCSASPPPAYSRSRGRWRRTMIAWCSTRQEPAGNRWRNSSTRIFSPA